MSFINIRSKINHGMKMRHASCQWQITMRDPNTYLSNYLYISIYLYMFVCARVCIKAINSLKHLQEKGNLFLVRSMNNLRNRKELTLRLTSIISKRNKLTYPEWYSFTDIMKMIKYKAAYTKEKLKRRRYVRSNYNRYNIIGKSQVSRWLNIDPEKKYINEDNSHLTRWFWGWIMQKPTL